MCDLQEATYAYPVLFPLLTPSNLPGGETNNIEEATVASLFASGYETKPALSVPILIVDDAAVPTELKGGDAIPPTAPAAAAANEKEEEEETRKSRAGTESRRKKTKEKEEGWPAFPPR